MINTKMEMLFVPYHFLQSVITKITGAVIVAGSAYFYINGTMSAVYAIGMTISAFMLYSSLECAGNYSSLLHVVSVCVDKANAILELDTMDIDGKEIQPENYDIRLSSARWSNDCCRRFLRNRERYIINDLPFVIRKRNIRKSNIVIFRLYFFTVDIHGIQLQYCICFIYTYAYHM